jgi:DNA-binding transcriptional LysR family regulator
VELRHLRTFRTVAILNSFNRAADVLFYAQSTVSEHIRSLEDDLKVRLFERMGKRIHLTEAGEKLLSYAQKMLDIEEELKVDVAGQTEPQGSLSIRIPITITTHYMPPIIRSFHHRYSRVGLDFLSCSYFSLKQELESGMLNLAFIILDSFHDQELETESLYPMPLALVANAGGTLASNRSLTPGDLKDELIYIAKHDCSYRLMLEKFLTERKINPEVLIELNSIESIKSCLGGGTGASLLPRITVQEELEKGLLVDLPILEEIKNPRLLMIWNRGRPVSRILEAFIGATRDHFHRLENTTNPA